jgi:hypothetical protein
MSRPVIFLDVSGVLISTAHQRGFKQAPLHPPAELLYIPTSPAPFLRSALAALAHLTACSGAQLVLSSTWRLAPSGWRLGVLRAALQQGGVGAAALAGCTPVLPGCGRGAEVLAWLAQHPEVQHWVVLDDQLCLFEASLQAMQGRVLMCSPEVGLTLELAQEAAARLLLQQQQ